MAKAFVYNEEFTCTKGKEFFQDGVITFPNEPAIKNDYGDMRVDGTYLSCFGPSIGHNGQIFENTNHNVSIGMRRMTRARKANLRFHRNLQARQLRFFGTHMHIIDKLRELYSPTMSNFCSAVRQAEDHHADPHVKRHLRIQAWNDLLETGQISTRTWIRYVKYKMKKAEWAKPGKESRMIGDLGVPASLLGFRVTKYLKEAMEEFKFEINGGTIEFCAKPGHAKLKEIFRNLENPPRRFYFVYFSDDSCIAIRTANGTVIRGDVDIASCDASHGEALFNAFTRLGTGPAHDALSRLVAQCRKKIRVYDLDDTVKRDNYTELWGHGARLFSGSTLTTCMNNLANIMIAVAISEADIQSEADIHKASQEAGYSVTIDIAEEFEDMTFLKHSPVRDTSGDWQPVLNVGVLLRMSGVCKGDLPGSGPLAPRAIAFQRALLQGAYPRSSFPLVDNMKSMVAGSNAVLDKLMTKPIHSLLEYKIGEAAEQTHHFHPEDLYRRYRLQIWEMDVLDETFGHATFGQEYASPTVSAIMKRDYGLECQYL